MITGPTISGAKSLLRFGAAVPIAGVPALIWIEELIEVAESSASAPVYALLKREDERHVTMQAYDNPVFVEDIVRNVAAKLQVDERLTWFHVHALNHESIHNHGAFAEIEWAALLSSLNKALRIDVRSFIIVSVPETAVGVVAWVTQLISSSVVPTESAMRPLQVSPRVSWLDLTANTPADLEGAPKDRKGEKSIPPRTLYGRALVCRSRHSFGSDKIGAGTSDSGSARPGMVSFNRIHDQVLSGHVRCGNRRFGCARDATDDGAAPSLVDRRLLLCVFGRNNSFPRSFAALPRLIRAPR